jgi:hypothetical protein
MKSPDKETLELIEQSAQVCRDATLSNMGIELTFDEASIFKLDHLITVGWQSEIPSATTLQVWSCFLGEAMRKTLGGTWVMTEVGLGIAVGQNVAHPFTKIEKRFSNGHTEAITHFYRSFKDMCAQAQS